MSDPIVRLYASADHAQAAVRRLIDGQFGEESVTVVTAASRPPANAPASAASSDPVLSTILSRYVLRAHAEVYAAKVRNGGALVIAEPYFGGGSFVEQLLDQGGQTIDTGVRIEPRDPLPLWDDAAPLSSALRMPTIVRCTTPTSAFLVMPPLTRRFRTLSGAFGLPLLKEQGALLTRTLTEMTTVSGLLGLPLLIRR